MMSRRYVLAPEAALDLVQIWRYIKKNVRLGMADRVVSVIRAEDNLSCGKTRRGPLAQGFDG
jgi:hypothetical protein